MFVKSLCYRYNSFLPGSITSYCQIGKKFKCDWNLNSVKTTSAIIKKQTAFKQNAKMSHAVTCGLNSKVAPRRLSKLFPGLTIQKICWKGWHLSLFTSHMSGCKLFKLSKQRKISQRSTESQQSQSGGFNLLWSLGEEGNMWGQGEQGDRRRSVGDNICASCKVSSHLNPGGGINYLPHCISN